MTPALANFLTACPRKYFLLRGDQIQGHTENKDAALEAAEKNGRRVAWRNGGDVWEWEDGRADYDEMTDETTLIGWEWGKKLKNAPVKDFGYGIINHYIHANELKPIEELKQKIKV